MIERKEYLEKLFAFKDKNLIKVITGIRRCGKSTLLKQFQQKLLEQGIDKSQIISINFEDADFEYLQDYKKLHEYVKDRLIADKKNYVFLDEIQNVPQYEKAVDSFYIKENVDVYITGSNAHFLSSELATLLSGRYITIKMLPLSFKEYISKFGKNDLSKKYVNYLVNSSFPGTLELSEGGYDSIREYLEGIYNTVILKDVMGRKEIQSKERLQSLVKFLFDNIGNLTSINKISNVMSSKYNTKISRLLVENYITALIDCFLLYKVNRYDVKGKQHLQTNEKYYIADIGLRYYLLGRRADDLGHILENVVYLELLRRGYEVFVGKVNQVEVDFVAIKNGEPTYFQVAQTVMAEETLKRELRPLENIKDHNPKYILTMDVVPEVSYEGIKQINVLDWLLD